MRQANLPTAGVVLSTLVFCVPLPKRLRTDAGFSGEKRNARICDVLNETLPVFPTVPRQVYCAARTSGFV